MCFGGGGGGTITVPDYKAYDQQFDLQKAAIEQASSQSILTYDTDLAVQAGNSCEISIASTTAVTADAAVTLTFS